MELYSNDGERSRAVYLQFKRRLVRAHQRGVGMRLTPEEVALLALGPDGEAEESSEPDAYPRQLRHGRTT